MRKVLLYALMLITVCTNAQTPKAVLAEATKPPLDTNTLIVINGIVAGPIGNSKQDFNAAFKPDMIERVNVLKGPDAIAKYGEKGKAGVIEITLKNATVLTPADSVRTKVEIEASFPGSDLAWRRYLERNVNASIPSNKGAPEGLYTTITQFVVELDGSISTVTPLTKHGYGMEEEAMRVISKGPNWVPAMQNGKPVRAYRKQPITFQVVSEDWFKLSTTTIKAGQRTLIEIKEMDQLKDDEIEVTVSPGTITHDSGKKYYVTVDKPGTAFITITKKAKKKKDQFDYGSMQITVE